MVEDIRNLGLTKEEITEILKKIGEKLGFISETEVNTGFSKVDVVWFDSRIPLIWIKQKKMLENSLALPIVGFEIEEKTYVRKSIRGDVDSLNSLSPQLGVIVFSDKIKTVTIYNRMEKEVFKKYPELKGQSNNQKVWKNTQERTKRFWDTSMRTFQKFVAASPHCRVVIWEEEDLIKINKRINDG